VFEVEQDEGGLGDRDDAPGAQAAEQLAHQQDGHIPARGALTERLTSERAGEPRPLRAPGHRHAFPNRPAHQRTLSSRAASGPEAPGHVADTWGCSLREEVAFGETSSTSRRFCLLPGPAWLT
jgi:hypothetical protein